MSKINFTFLRKKLFYAGLITGVFITAMLFILIISFHYPPAEKNKLTGTMMEDTWVPATGETGVVVSSGNTCNYYYCDVVFDNDPNHAVIRCHSSAPFSPSMDVEVYSSTGGDFCQGGGVSVGFIPGQN